MFLKQIRLLLLLLMLMPVGRLLAAGDTLSISIFIQDVVSVDDVFVPSDYALHPPYPNPFNPDVNLVVDIPQTATTRISILNLRGQEVAILENRQLAPGRYDYQWRASGQPSGTYFARIRAGQFETSEKISLLK